MRETGLEEVWVVGSLLICASVLAHGVSATPLAKLYGRTGRQADDKLLGAVRAGLAERAYHGLVFKFIDRADADALADGECLFKLYATEADRYRVVAKQVLACPNLQGTVAEERLLNVNTCPGVQHRQIGIE